MAPARERDLVQEGADTFSVFHSGQSSQGRSTARRVDAKLPVMQCELIASSVAEYCGLSKNFADLDSSISQLTTEDLSAFTHLQLKVHVRSLLSGLEATASSSSGESQDYLPPARLLLRTVNASLSEDYQMSEPVVSSYILQAQDLGRAFALPFTDFSTAEWWILQSGVSTRDAQLAMDQAVQIGVELPPESRPGRYEVVIEDMTLIGEWVTASGLLLFLFSTWMISLAALSIAQILRLRRETSLAAEQIGELTEDNQALRTQSNFFEKLSTYDSLSNILNRHGFLQERSVLLQNNDLEEYCIALADLDHFKAINDTYGHNAGDLIIKDTALMIRESTRNTDLVARWGGEEFLILFPTATLQNAARICQKIADRMQSVKVADHKDTSVTLSFGIAIGSVNERFEDVLERADRQLYRAKQNGRDQICH